MKIPPKLKIGLGLMVVFVAGAICGGVGTVRYLEKSLARSMNYKFWSATVMKDLNSRLHFTPEQQQKAQAILDDTGDGVVNTFKQLGSELIRLHSRLHAILTPEQQARHTAMLEGFRKELKDRYNWTIPAETPSSNAAPVITPSGTSTTSTSNQDDSKKP